MNFSSPPKVLAPGTRRITTPTAWRQKAPSPEMAQLANPTEPFLHLLGRQLGQQELRRRLWHFLPGMMALCMATVPHREVVRLWVMVLIVIVGILIPACLAIRYQRVYRRHANEDITPSIFGYVLPLTLLAFLDRGHVEIPLTVAAIIAFGDGSATLFGLLLRGTPVPWNPQKSWAGLLAFLIVGTTLSSLVYWVATGDVSFHRATLFVSPVVLAAAVLESLPLKWNDNLTIGFSSAALFLSMQVFVTS